MNRLMKDFTLGKYSELVSAFLGAGYTVMPFGDWCETRPQGRVLVLRHDVDACPRNSLAVAELEHSLGVRSSFYFRVVPQSFNPSVIRGIAALGHEIGYHYEDLSLFNGDREQAILHFQNQLIRFRQFYPVRTICMHGAPATRYDGRDLWRKTADGKPAYDYRNYGIIGEPYFDIDFSRMFYLTDTGRCWDGWKVSVRDKVAEQDKWVERGWTFHASDHIVSALQSRSSVFAEQFPVMLTTHPQRWTDNPLLWCHELLAQNLKNVVKRVLISARNNKTEH